MRESSGSTIKINHFWFLFLSGILFLMIVLRDVLYIDIPNFAFIAVSAISYLFFSYEEMVAYSLMMIPLGCGLAVNYTIGIGLIVMIFKNNLRITKYWVPFVFLLMFEFLHAILYEKTGIADYFRWMLCMLMLMQIAYDTRSIENDVFILKAFLYASLFILIDIFIQTALFSGGIGVFLRGELRFGTINNFFTLQTNVVSSLNQNTVGQLAVVSMAILLMLWNKKRINICEFFVLIALFSMFGFLCMSRTFFVTLVITLIAYIIMATEKVGDAVKNVVFLLILCIVATYIIQLIFPSTIETTLDRFNEDDVSSGRTEIFKKYNQYMLDNPGAILVGIGNLYKSEKTHIHSPHNAIQELFVSWGVVGCVLMGSIIFNMAVCSIKRMQGRKPDKIAYLPFVPFLISVQSGQLFSANERMLYFALCFIALQVQSSSHNRMIDRSKI